MVKRDLAASFLFIFFGELEIIKEKQQGQEFSFKVKTKTKDFSINASKFTGKSMTKKKKIPFKHTLAQACI